MSSTWFLATSAIVITFVCAIALVVLNKVLISYAPPRIVVDAEVVNGSVVARISDGIARSMACNYAIVELSVPGGPVLDNDIACWRRVSLSVGSTNVFSRSLLVTSLWCPTNNDPRPGRGCIVVDRLAVPIRGAVPIARLLNALILERGQRYELVSLTISLANAGDLPLYITDNTITILVGNRPCPSAIIHGAGTVEPKSRRVIIVYTFRCQLPTLGTPIYLVIKGVLRSMKLLLTANESSFAYEPIK